ncbi:Ldh family oxidoreductase [Rhizobiaceae bacterium BDR2-2]|uniref:Ldh family oxidoreductase n=1 Tax=Ectorhizobium quercum TaxID=2965071 RepID=A0AAE3SUS0_9HYPH|nr:Ldh family oxidoreductase [Ectorhizobium quercum]MCX8995575.1 Ldh family oxidoreductase [Ectorhizobium quercum]
MKLSIAEAHRLVSETLEKNRVSPANAAAVARALVEAEAVGQSGHGLRRVEAYSLQARIGKVDGFARPVVEESRPGVLKADAASGFAYPAFECVLPRLADVALRQGIAVAAVSRSHHAGVLGLHVEYLANRGLVALMVANAPAAMAAWGGRRPMFGTNPVAFAAPIAGSDPVVIDMALSTVARGRLIKAAQKGEPIPEDWALGPDGNPTTDPKVGLAGTMMPSGGAKGAALAMMVDLMAAGLTGAQFGFEASSLLDDKGPSPAIGQTIVAIDPQATGGSADYMARLAEELGREEGVRLPGRRGADARRRSLESGIEVDDDVLEAIRALQSNSRKSA